MCCIERKIFEFTSYPKLSLSLKYPRGSAKKKNPRGGLASTLVKFNVLLFMGSIFRKGFIVSLVICCT